MLCRLYIALNITLKLKYNIECKVKFSSGMISCELYAWRD